MESLMTAGLEGADRRTHVERINPGDNPAQCPELGIVHVRDEAPRPIPADAPQGEPEMTNDERALLLTVARLMRARLREIDPNGLDHADICDALRPFDPADAAPVNQDNSAAPPAP